MTLRYLRPDELPPSLWDPGNRVLRLPPELAEAYRKVLSARGLEELARKRSGSPVGGLTKEQAEEHFAQAFDGSVARIELALLDPLGKVPHISDSLVRVFAGGGIALLDIPSGAGALALGLLCAVAELRAQAVLPRERLDVAIVCGELSEHARTIAAELFGAVTSQLHHQAIFPELHQLHWDACDKLSTTELVKRFTVTSASSTKKQVAVSNFTGALSREGKLKDAKPQIEEIFRYALGANSGAIWIEPNTNSATSRGGVLLAVADFLKQQLGSVIKLVVPPGRTSDESAVATTEVTFESAIPERGRPMVRLAVLRFRLDREGS